MTFRDRGSRVPESSGSTGSNDFLKVSEEVQEEWPSLEEIAKRKCRTIHFIPSHLIDLWTKTFGLA